MKIVKNEKKEFKIEVWTVDNYPINIKTLKPLFHILGFASKNISKFNEFISY